MMIYTKFKEEYYYIFTTSISLLRMRDANMLRLDVRIVKCIYFSVREITTYI